jgi:alpha-ketoglutarate-dependent taurine dioxygenase
MTTLTEIIADERAWRAEAIDAPPSWSCPLPDALFSALDPMLRDLCNNPRPVTEIRTFGDLWNTFAPALRPALAALQSGRGFALIERVPPARYSPQEARAIYWTVGQLLGRPFEQDVKGTLLYDVRDTGQRVTQGVRFSVTNAESSFHTDNSFGRDLPDYVGLLCLATAKAGGLSQLVNAYALHNELLAHHPDALETLYQPFHFDRRGEFREGESPTSRSPVFGWDGHGLTVRYLHYYIEVGHEKAGQPLTPAQGKALDALEALLARPDLRVEFALHPGQMLFTNNRSILHNRTAFEDHPEPERRRHYVRLWLKSRETADGRRQT